jgi:hypothetical protein
MRFVGVGVNWRMPPCAAHRLGLRSLSLLDAFIAKATNARRIIVKQVGVFVVRPPFGIPDTKSIRAGPSYFRKVGFGWTGVLLIVYFSDHGCR